MDFVSTNLGGAIVDNVTMTKTSTCNFGMLCEPEATITEESESVDRRSVEKGVIRITMWQQKVHYR
mgnify:CR=1 FL=1